MHIIIDLLILVTTIILGIPVPFCFMAAALYMGLVFFPDFSFLMTVGFRGLNSLTLLSIPFFIMAGPLWVQLVSLRSLQTLPTPCSDESGAVWGRPPL